MYVQLHIIPEFDDILNLLGTKVFTISISLCYHFTKNICKICKPCYRHHKLVTICIITLHKFITIHLLLTHDKLLSYLLQPHDKNITSAVANLQSVCNLFITMYCDGVTYIIYLPLEILLPDYLECNFHLFIHMCTYVCMLVVIISNIINMRDDFFWCREIHPGPTHRFIGDICW